MKKMISLLLALALCLGLAGTALAADEFVPSITYKNGPKILSAYHIGEGVDGAEDVGSCLVVSSIRDARNKSTDITQDARDLLLDVYGKLADNSMTLPLSEDYVIRELVDVSYRQSACVEKEHGHVEWLAKDNTVLKLVFDLGVAKNVDVQVFAFKDEKWEAIKSVENNNDGTITCEFERLCPVAFTLSPEDQTIVTKPPRTGDELGLWVGLALLSVAACGFVLAARRKVSL